MIGCRAAEPVPAGGEPTRPPGGQPSKHPAPATAALTEAELPNTPRSRGFPPFSHPRLTHHLAISLGGFLGANVRYLIGSWAATHWGAAFPWGTFLINMTGSLAIGFYLTLVSERFPGRVIPRLFFATGFLGAYTTFSAFSQETVTLLQHGALAAAGSYVVASLVLGLAAAGAGRWLARAF